MRLNDYEVKFYLHSQTHLSFNKNVSVHEV